MTTDDKASGLSLVKFELGRHAGKEGGALVAFKTLELTLRALRDYHQHRVIGLENLPKTGPALVICHHSFATYDSFLLVVAVFDALDRVMWGVADRLIFRTPGLGGFFRRTGFTEGTRDELVALLQLRRDGRTCSGRHVREALRVARNKYESRLEEAPGLRARVDALGRAHRAGSVPARRRHLQGVRQSGEGLGVSQVPYPSSHGSRDGADLLAAADQADASSSRSPSLRHSGARGGHGGRDRRRTAPISSNEWASP